MSKQEYPDYIYRMMDEAARLLAVEDDPDPWEAAALCFDILAAFPEHEAARELYGVEKHGYTPPVSVSWSR